MGKKRGDEDFMGDAEKGSYGELRVSKAEFEKRCRDGIWEAMGEPGRSGLVEVKDHRSGKRKMITVEDHRTDAEESAGEQASEDGRMSSIETRLQDLERKCDAAEKRFGDYVVRKDAEGTGPEQKKLLDRLQEVQKSIQRGYGSPELTAERTRIKSALEKSGYPNKSK